MSQPHFLLQDFKPKHPYFVAFDSDGCVFDNMEIKQKACFIPMIVKCWQLEAISKYAWETAEFVNLYSIWRGGNRFAALVRIFDLLKIHPEVKKHSIELPDTNPLREFVNSGEPLSNPSLAEWIHRKPHPFLKQTLDWSFAVNQLVDEKINQFHPFPQILNILQKLSQTADIIVSSSTTVGTLHKEWQVHSLAPYITLIAGQEMGTKQEHLGMTAKGNYDPDKMLMIGDTPGDKNAAHTIQALFFPIFPGHELASWENFQQEAMDRFLNGTFAGSYQAKLIEEFDQLLPEKPPLVF